MLRRIHGLFVLLGFALLLVILFAPVQARGGEIADYFSTDDPGRGPLVGRNTAPVVNLFYLMPVARADTLGRNGFQFDLNFDMSNISQNEAVGSSQLIHDMEIYRTSFQFTYGLWETVDLHLEIPTLAFNGGFLDGFIQDYHSAFGFPNGGREQVPNGVEGYFFAMNGQTVYNYPSLDFAIGDINLDVKWLALKEGTLWPGIALRAGVKFPSGDFDKGSGSGEFDYGFGFTLSKNIRRFSFFAGLDGIIIEDPAVWRSFVDGEIIHYFGGVEFALIKTYLSFLFEIEGQTTPFVNTGLPQLDREIADFYLGFRGAFLKEHMQWQLAMRQELITKSTTDVSFNFGIGTRF